MQNIALLLAALCLVSLSGTGCNNQPSNTTPTEAKPLADSEALPESQPPEPTTSSLLITSDSVGEWKVGTLSEQITGAPAEDYSTVDLGKGVSASFFEGKICAFYVESPLHKTKEGLGVGKTRAEFEAVYGEAIFEEATGDYFLESAWFALSGDTIEDASAAVSSIRVGGCPE